MQGNQLILGKYQPMGRAGAGGFGTVIIAWDTVIQRKVAIKIIPLTEIDEARASLPGNAVPRHDSAHTAQGGISSQQSFEDWENPWNSSWKSGSRGWAAGDQAGALGSRGGWAPDGSHGLADGARDGNTREARWMADVPGLDEARTAAMLQDANIVTIYDFEIRDHQAFLIMEYVEGITLSRLLRTYNDELTLDVIAVIFQGVSHALEVAHRQKVFHLDIKPDNILINTDGQVKVTDFGLATLADAQGFGTADAGTIGYMPLEQICEQHLDARTDEWALASVVYEMLVGTNPFKADTLQDAREAIENAELVLPSVCWDNMSEDVDDIVFCALCPSPAGRYKKVKDFREELMPHLGDVRSGCADLADMVYEETHPQFDDLEEGGELPGDDANSTGRPRSAGRRAASMAVRVVGALVLLAVAVVLAVNGQPIAGVAFVAVAVLWWIILMKLPPLF